MGVFIYILVLSAGTVLLCERRQPALIAVEMLADLALVSAVSVLPALVTFGQVYPTEPIRIEH